MTDFLILYNPSTPWSDINKTLVDNIVKIYKADCRIHIYGVDPSVEYENMRKIKLISDFMSSTQCGDLVVLDSDTLLIKKLDVFQGESFDVGLTIRQIKYFAPNPKCPMHNYFNQGVLFFRNTPKAREFMLRWIHNMTKAYNVGARDSYVDQSCLAITALESAFSLKDTLAYAEGLVPGTVYTNKGITIKLFSCGKYNYAPNGVGREQYIYHFKDELIDEGVRTQMIMKGRLVR